jgi:hypothetical protein
MTGEDHLSGGQLAVDAVDFFDNRVAFDPERTGRRLRRGLA